jgi:3-deoxy-manno-octulosonate cytidylyltransferase (CMP-KDO synthetase)
LVYRSSDCVKVIQDTLGDALYFSRSPLPWNKGHFDDTCWPMLHLGVYCFQRPYLWPYKPDRPQCYLARAENLEQLQMLWHRVAIRVGEIEMPHQGINTYEDYIAFVSRNREEPACVSTKTAF